MQTITKHLFLIAVSTLFAWQAMADSDVIITQQDHLSTIVLATGNRGVIELSTLLSAGFRYEVKACDATIVNVLGSQFEETSGMLGAPAIQRFYFIGVSKGKTRLTLINKRPFEAAVVKTFSITIASQGRYRGNLGLEIQDSN